MTDTNTQLTQEQVEDYVGGMVAGNTETGITVTYEDGDGTLDFVVADTTVAGDSGSTGITPGDTLTIAGGSNVTTAMSGDTLTITATDTNTMGSGFTVSATTDSNATTITQGDDLMFAAGTGITCETTADGTVTISSTVTDTNTQLSTEEVQDIVGGMVSGNTETGITVTYEDGDGTLDFVVGTLNQDTTGTAAIATTVTVADESSDTTCFPLFVTAATGDLAPKSGSNLTFNSDTGVLTATGFSGPLTGNVTGNVSGSSGSCTGNAGTVTNGVYTTSKISVLAATTSSELAGVISDETGSGSLVFSNSPTLVTPALGTPSALVGTNITGTGASFTAGTATVATTVTITDNESTNEDNAIIFAAGGDVDGGNLGLESDGTLTYNPSTGKITATGFIGALTGNADTVTNGVYTSNNLSVMAATTSAQLAGVISDETGSGSLVFSNSPTLVTPALGTPSALVGTNITGTGASFTAGTATVATTVTITDNESTNEDNAIIFAAGGDVDGGNLGLESDGDLTYNPSTGTVTATIFKGNIDAVDGDFDGTLEADAITIGGTAIGSIYSPLAGGGDIVTTGALNSGSITSGFGSIDNGSSTFNTGAATVDSLDVSDGNIANVGDIDCDSISVADAANGLNVDLSGANTGTGKITLKDNVASALDITESSNSYMKFVTTDNAERIVTNVGVAPDMSSTALTSQSGSVTIDASNGNYFTVATSGNITGLDITNAVVGQRILIRFAWGGTHSLAFSNTTVIWPGGTSPTVTASGVDVYGFICTTASSAFDGFIVGADVK